MAEKSDSRNALVVALSIFVVLTIGLAFSTYYGFVEQNKLRDEAKNATDKEAKAVPSLEGALAKANENIAQLKRENEANKASARAALDELQRIRKSIGLAETEANKASAQAELDELQRSLQAKSKELEQELARPKKK